MSRDSGVVMIAFGDKAQAERALSAKSLREHCDLPVVAVTHNHTGLPDKAASRSVKTGLLNVAAFENVLYLDSDTRVHSDLSAGFGMLDAGWDLAISFSDHQGRDAFWHVDDTEREQTFVELGFVPLQYQCGVMFVKRNSRTEAFFSAWHEEWGRYQGEDQAAFVRALHRVPLKVWLLGKAWNGGSIVAHRYGACR